MKKNKDAWIVLIDTGKKRQILDFHGEKFFNEKEKALFLAVGFVNNNLSLIDKTLAREMTTMAISCLEKGESFKCTKFGISIVEIKITSKGKIVGVNFNE